MALTAIDLAFVGDHAELAVSSLDAAFTCADDVALMAQAVADEFRYGEHQQAVLFAEWDEVGDAGHRAVVAHDFADDAGRDEAGETGEIDRGLGLAGADEDAATTGAQRENVAGAGEIGGGGLGIDGGADRVGAVGGRDAGGDTFAGLDGLSKSSAKARGVLLRHGKEAQVVGSLLSKGQTDKAAAVAGHEVDGFGGNKLRGKCEIALIFAVLVVDHDHHATGANLGQCAGDVGEGGLDLAGRIGHGSAVAPRLDEAALFSLIRGGNARSGRGGRLRCSFPLSGDATEICKELPNQ